MATLISLLILVLVVVILFWLVDAIPLPVPINTIVKSIIAMIAIIEIIHYLGVF